MSLQGTVDPDSTFKDGDDLSRLAMYRALWTCAIFNGVKTRGTGLLIGENLVLTNYHVIQELLANPASARDAVCCFDYKRDLNTYKVQPGRDVRFAETWEVAKSAYSALDISGASTGFSDAELDFAIVRLDENVGMQPVRIDAGTIPHRRWMTLPENPRLPRPGSNIYIWQHPADRSKVATGTVLPRQQSSGLVQSLLDGDLRMRHAATTYQGSSGAGCFDADLNLVALHHASDPTVDPNSIARWNQAIPISAIVRHLKNNPDLRHIVGLNPPPEVAPEAPPPPPAREIRSQQLDDVIQKKIRAAKLLMDRDHVESYITWTRSDPDNHGMVHALACRHIDSHRNFIDRLGRLSLLPGMDTFDDRERQLDAFLDGRGNEAWKRVSLTFPHNMDNIGKANRFIQQQLMRSVNRAQPTLVEASVDIKAVNTDHQLVLLKELANICRAIGDADRLQVIVIYYDAEAKQEKDDLYAGKRNDLGKLWQDEDRPPGLGFCADLEDIASIDLNGWCQTLQGRWRIDDDQLPVHVEAALGGEPMPMLDAEQRIEPILRSYLARLL